jgi:hypothetical protein
MKQKLYFSTDKLLYPSKEEWLESEKQFPDIRNFGFPYKREFELIFGSKIPLNEKPRESNLYWWDLCLTNKIGKLKLAFISLNTHFQRYTKEFEINRNEINIHRLQFDFYLESYFYFLFSLRDNIFQIINLYFYLKIDEEKVSIPELFKELKKKKISMIHLLLSKLIEDFKDASDIRNSFTHRFPKNQKDYRMIFDKDKMILYPGTGKEMAPSELMPIVKDSLQIMDKFILDLKNYIIVR